METKIEQHRMLSSSIRETYARARSVFRECASSISDPSLSWIEIMVLNDLFTHRKEKTSAREVAARLRLSKASLSQNLALLDAKGMVGSRTSTKDRRVKWLYLTKRGEEWITRVHTSFDSLVLRMGEGISPEEREVALRVLEKIRENCGLLSREQKERKRLSAENEEGGKE